MKKVLIFGLDSFTGVYLKKYLIEKGYDVYGSIFSGSKSEKIFICDITNQYNVDLIFDQINPDFIFILAGISRSVNENPTEVYNINIFGPLNILESLKKKKINPTKIIFSSSASVYGIYDNEISEDHIKNPINHYGNSKLVAENMITNFFDEFNIIITRPFNYFGAGQNKFFIMPKILNHFKFFDKRKPQDLILGNLNVFREFNDVLDVVDCYYRLMNIKGSSIKVNICSNRKVSISDVLKIAFEFTENEVNVISNNNFKRKNEINNLQGDDTLLCSLIGNNNFKISINDSIKNYLNG
jgi:GDP-6-deoxy-D-talose 4-dehydrogenase